MIRQFIALLAPALLAVALSGCANPLWGGKTAYLEDYNETAVTSGAAGAVMLHAINRGGLIATRWLKVDTPAARRSFTVFHSNRHRALDAMDGYDVVTVAPGTYALYSVFSNCEEGLRPSSTNMDEPWREGVATPLGQTSWVRSWKPGDAVSTSIGLWGGSGGGARAGLGAGMSIDGVGNAPGQPVATCNLLSQGVRDGAALLATVTVRPGELVYAGELEIDYGDNGQCETAGNWMADNETSRHCGAAWVTVDVTNQYGPLAAPFIERALGPEALKRAVVRLAVPGKMAR